MFIRELQQTIREFSKFPAIALLGPRQSGKTTLAREIFPNHIFISFDDMVNRALATDDPKLFLQRHENAYGIVIDEFQYVPGLMPYIKMEIDFKKRPGYFILTGSENYLMNQAITESLAGRVGILNLFPLSLSELADNKLLSDSVDEVIFKGGYPRIYYENFSAIQFYPSYIQSYVERDVRRLINVENLSVFKQFMQLCAGRIGNLLNIEGLCNDVGISFATARRWLSILESSYIIFFLEPYYQSFNKRLVKSPKLYFYDTGLACSLLRLTTVNELVFSPLRGPLFESLILSDIIKQYANQGMRSPLYYWRDRGHEIDGLVDQGSMLFPIEIKSSSSWNVAFFNSLNYWNEIAEVDPKQGFLVYGGKDVQERSKGTVVGWQDARNLKRMIDAKITTRHKILKAQQED